MKKLASALPAPKDELPLIGIAHRLVGNTEIIMNQLQQLSYESMQNNGIIRGWMGHILFFIVVDPVDLEMVLKTCMEKDDLHRFIRKIIGNGGIFAPVSIWRHRRKVLVPAFSPRIVENFVHVFAEQSEKLVKQLTTSAGKGKFNIWPFLSSYTLDSVCVIMNQLQQLSYESMQNNGIIRGWMGHILFFIVVDPVDLEMVLKTCMEKDDLHRFIRKIIGNGGIFAPVSIWRHRRKVLVPAFSPRIVENFVHVFAEQSEKLVKQLTTSAGKGKFNIWPFLSSYTLDSVCDTTIGVKINAQEDPDHPFLNAISHILNLVCERIFHLWLQPDWLYQWFPQYKRHQKYMSVMHNFIDQVIEKKREELKLEKESRTEVDHEFDLGSYKKQTFLDLLIQLSGGEKGYTNVELREEVLTLTVAGTDTSAVAMGYTLQLLAKYPEIQEKVYQELCEVFEEDRMLVKEDLIKLKYLDRVVKESLRLFPPVPLIIRKVLEDITLPSGRVLPAGSGVVCSIWGVHRDRKYWGTDAEVFDPDRFLPERFNLQHPCSYMPFSNGPRNCLGYQYALMSVKTALSTILRQYKVVEDREDGPVPKIRVKLDIMMKAVDGYQVALERRENLRDDTNKPGKNDS